MYYKVFDNKFYIKIWICKFFNLYRYNKEFGIKINKEFGFLNFL